MACDGAAVVLYATLLFMVAVSCGRLVTLESSEDWRSNSTADRGQVTDLHRHRGRLVIGLNSSSWKRLPAANAGYQADMGWMQPPEEGAGFSQQRPSDVTVEQIRKMEPKVECSADSMRLQVQNSATTPGSLFLIDRGRHLSALPLSKLPASCGYTVKSTHQDLVVVAPYDGCFVTQEEDNYVLPMLWLGLSVRMLCPQVRPCSSKPPTVTCYAEGMVVKLEWPLSETYVKVRGSWEPLMEASQQCGFGVVEHSEGVVVSVDYRFCLQKNGGRYTLEVAGDRKSVISCPISQPQPDWTDEMEDPGKGGYGDPQPPASNAPPINSDLLYPEPGPGQPTPPAFEKPWENYYFPQGFSEKPSVEQPGAPEGPGQLPFNPPQPEPVEQPDGPAGGKPGAPQDHTPAIPVQPHNPQPDLSQGSLYWPFYYPYPYQRPETPPFHPSKPEQGPGKRPDLPPQGPGYPPQPGQKPGAPQVPGYPPVYPTYPPQPGQKPGAPQVPGYPLVYPTYPPQPGQKPGAPQVPGYPPVYPTYPPQPGQKPGAPQVPGYPLVYPTYPPQPGQKPGAPQVPGYPLVYPTYPPQPGQKPDDPQVPGYPPVYPVYPPQPGQKPAAQKPDAPPKKEYTLFYPSYPQPHPEKRPEGKKPGQKPHLPQAPPGQPVQTEQPVDGKVPHPIYGYNYPKYVPYVTPPPALVGQNPQEPTVPQPNGGGVVPPRGSLGLTPSYCICPSGFGNCCPQIAFHQHHHHILPVAPGSRDVPPIYTGLPFVPLVAFPGLDDGSGSPAPQTPNEPPSTLAPPPASDGEKRPYLQPLDGSVGAEPEGLPVSPAQTYTYVDPQGVGQYWSYPPLSAGQASEEAAVDPAAQHHPYMMQPPIYQSSPGNMNYASAPHFFSPPLQQHAAKQQPRTASEVQPWSPYVMLQDGQEPTQNISAPSSSPPAGRSAMEHKPLVNASSESNSYLLLQQSPPGKVPQLLSEPPFALRHPVDHGRDQGPGEKSPEKLRPSREKTPHPRWPTSFPNFWTRTISKRKIQPRALQKAFRRWGAAAEQKPKD